MGLSAFELPVTPPTVRHLRVLCVDDNRDAARTLGFLAGLWGYETQICYDPGEALREFQSDAYDVVLLDIAMPGLSGWDLARRFRELAAGRDLLLIAVSGLGDAEARRKSRGAGIPFHFAKPLDPVRLREVLDDYEAGLGRKGW